MSSANIPLPKFFQNRTNCFAQYTSSSSYRICTLHRQYDTGAVHVATQHQPSVSIKTKNSSKVSFAGRSQKDSSRFFRLCFCQSSSKSHSHLSYYHIFGYRVCRPVNLQSVSVWRQNRTLTVLLCNRAIHTTALKFDNVVNS